MVKCNNKVFLGLSIAGLLITIIVAIIGFVVYPIILENQIIKQVEIREGTEPHDRFLELPIDVDFKAYMFNITNPEEVTFNNAYPIVTEIGPYVYRQKRWKENITYDKMDDTWKYLQYRHYEFDAEASHPLTEDDRVIMLNAAVNGLFQMIEDFLSPALANILFSDVWQEMFPDTTTMFHEVRVADILFDGYRFCSPEYLTFLSRIFCFILRQGNVKFMEIQDDNSIEFAYFAYKQDTHDGVYTVDAGMEYVRNVGLIRQWEGYAYLDVWNGRMSHCNKITGRDSTLYQPFLEEEDTVEIFASDMCRTITIEYSHEDEVKGIKGQTRLLAPGALLTPSINPDNACYCNERTKNLYGELECLPSGFLPAEQCIGAPVIGSLPHLMEADEEYRKTVEGLAPNPDVHAIYVTLEPQTGTPLDGRNRLQFNMFLRPIGGINITQYLNYSVVPIMWIEEGAMITEDMAEEFRSRFLTLIRTIDILVWVFIGVGIVLFVGFGGYYVYRIRHDTATTESS